MSIIHILKKISVGKTSEELLAIAEEIEATQHYLGVHNAQRAKLKEEYERENAVYDKVIKNVQDSCGHYATTYHGDPSGGSDSHDTCDICGKIVGRREYRRS